MTSMMLSHQRICPYPVPVRCEIHPATAVIGRGAARERINPVADLCGSWWRVAHKAALPGAIYATLQPQPAGDYGGGER